MDNTALALQMNPIAGEFGVTASILLKVNASGEESKFGLTPTSLSAALEELLPVPHVRIEGLMKMATFSENPESARPVFEGLRKLRDALTGASGHPLKELSMGMSEISSKALRRGRPSLGLVQPFSVPARCSLQHRFNFQKALRHEGVEMSASHCGIICNR